MATRIELFESTNTEVPSLAIKKEKFRNVNVNVNVQMTNVTKKCQMW